MTTEAIEGNVEIVEGNVAVEPEATELVAPLEGEPVAEAAGTDFEAEAARLVEAEAAQPQARPFTELTEEELLADSRVNSIVQKQRQSAAAQAEDKLRKQAGNDEAVRTYIRSLREAAESGDADAYERAASQALSLNREYQQDQVVEFFSQGLKELYRVPAENHEAAVMALQRGDRAAYITSLVDGAVAAKSADLKLADIPENAPLRAEIEADAKARAQRIVAAELKAKAIGANPRIEAPPAMPAGVPAGAGAMNSTKAGDAAYAAGTINGTQLRAVYQQFGETFPFE